MPKKPIVLTILDGWGYRPETHGNAIALARKPNYDRLLANYPNIRNQTRAIILVGDRRWNLRLTNGMDVRLPETGTEAALATLVKLDSDEQLLSRDITSIDLRLPDRVTVRLSEDAAKARADAIAASKPKRKAGDA